MMLVVGLECCGQYRLRSSLFKLANQRKLVHFHQGITYYYIEKF